MKFCSNCGKEIEDNATFCSSCGSKVGEIQRTINGFSYLKAKKIPISLILVICSLISIFIPGVNTIFSSSYSLFSFSHSFEFDAIVSVFMYILLLLLSIDGLILFKFFIDDKYPKTYKLHVLNIFTTLFAIFLENILITADSKYGMLVEKLEIGAILMPTFLIACCICLFIKNIDN